MKKTVTIILTVEQARLVAAALQRVDPTGFFFGNLVENIFTMAKEAGKDETKSDCDAGCGGA